MQYVHDAIAALVDGDAFGDAGQSDGLLGIEAVALGQVEQVDQSIAHGQVLAWFGDQVDERIARAPVGDVADAARDHDLSAGSRGLHLLQRLKLPVHAVFGLLADDARVQHDHVRIVRPVGGGEPVPLQALRQTPRVGNVHLAADRPDMEGSHGRARLYF